MENDPYRVWISEIILQQTQVKQGTAYYQRFIDRFPDVYSLAMSTEQEVLKVWQGLGYYSRARNLHIAAKQIVDEYNGHFPHDYHMIRKLKGVGEYTAAAIASIAFGLPYAAVDGNVYRVLSRIFEIETPIDQPKGKKEFSDLAHQLIDRTHPGRFNEALMEFGALQCVPKNPQCDECPFEGQCLAKAHHKIAQLPVKAKKGRIKDRYFTYLHLHYKDTVYLEKRIKKDIWQNLYQFPLIETLKTLTPEELKDHALFTHYFSNKPMSIEAISSEIIHQLTHQKLHVVFVEIILGEAIQWPGLIAIPNIDLHNYPIPTLIHNYLMDKKQ